MNIMFVGAHPDDIEVFAGGTALKYAARGHKLYFCVVTTARQDAGKRNRFIRKAF